MAVRGDATLDPDGVLDGWCWDPARPGERLIVEILLDDTLVASQRASRARDDVRNAENDGFCGFFVRLTAQLSATSPLLIAARVRGEAQCFWQKQIGAYRLPAGLQARMAASRAAIGQIAQSPGLRASNPAQTAQIAGAVATLGTTLLARAGITPAAPPKRPFTLPALAAPRLSVIFDAGPHPAAILQTLRCAMPALARAQAEAILTDAGEAPATAQSQRQARNLKYLLCPGQPPSIRRNLALASARGTAIAFLNAAPARLDPILNALANAIAISPDLASAALRIAPKLSAQITQHPNPAPSGLQLAATQSSFTQYGKFDRQTDDGAGLDLLDWILRAGHAGALMTTWAGNAPPARPRPTNPEAGRRFAERWVGRV